MHYGRVSDMLKFVPDYIVGTEWIHQSDDEIKVFRALRDVFDVHKIPYFVLVQDEGPITSVLAGGLNLDKRLHIPNQRPDLFPL